MYESLASMDLFERGTRCNMLFYDAENPGFSWDLFRIMFEYLSKHKPGETPVRVFVSAGLRLRVSSGFTALCAGGFYVGVPVCPFDQEFMNIYARYGYKRDGRDMPVAVLTTTGNVYFGVYSGYHSD